MADILPSETSIAAPAAATSIRDSSLEGGEEVNGEREAGELVKEQSVDTVEVTAFGIADAPLAGYDASEAGRPREEHDEGKLETVTIDPSSAPTQAMASDSLHVPVHEADGSATRYETATPTASPPARSSPEPSQTHVTAQPQPHVPMKRFTSVNINKRFLEKTPSTSGATSAGGQLIGHPSGAGNAGGLGQRRGVSPGSHSPANDRPASSRLVTAKLTAISPPSSASTSGWLRANSSTPANSATPTPPSSSPQPTPNESSTVSSTNLTHQQSMKRRPGDPPIPNGSSASALSSAAQQQGAKPVWGKVPPASNKGDLGRAAAAKDDFPTAAEAAHGRKAKALKSQLALDAVAAQTAAQKQAMIETAAAFRGAHLDANARHWDEMEDEDSDFLPGVIEFGDGRQYKIEHKQETAPSHGSPPLPDATQSIPKKAVQSHAPVTKEERFGEDIDRSWPRAKTSPLQSTSLPPQPTPLQHVSPTDGPASASTQSPHDGISPTSRVLFNERSNRLEPWSSTKTRLGPPPGPVPVTRRDGREDPPSFASLRQQQPPHLQGRDAPPHSHPSVANVQLLQKGPSSSGQAWKGGSSRGPDRGRWVDGPGSRGTPKDEEHSWEQRRRESMSSSDAPGLSVRDRSRGRDGRWDTGVVPQGRDAAHDRDGERRNLHAPPLPGPPSLAHERSRDAARQPPPHISRMQPPPGRPPHSMPGGDLPPHPSNARESIVSPPASLRSLRSPSEQAPSISSIPSAPGPNDVIDKDALVKDAMQLAIERARKRKQEGEAEEKRRSEAAERARKKAEALAIAQEEKKKAEVPPSTEDDKQSPQPSPPEGFRAPARPNGLETLDRHDEKAKDGKQPKAAPPDGSSGRPSTLHGRPNVPPPTLPRGPSIPPVPTPAALAESWRSRAAPVTSIPPRSSQASVPPTELAAHPLTTILPELDLSIKPDETVEVVDFSDLGKLVGATTPPEVPPASEHARLRRPVASDFFDDRPAEARQSPVFSKSDQPSWRQPLSKDAALSQASSLGEESRTQTMPTVPDDNSAPTKDATLSQEFKSSSSPTTASQPSKFQSPQGEHTPSNSISQLGNVPQALSALRSPRTSHFREAPMSTLTDTMSRIKGALDGMQSQDLPNLASAREANEKFPDHHALMGPTVAKAKANEPPAGSWREQRETRPEVPPQVTKFLSPSLVRPVSREIFDVTYVAPPQSPRPAWHAFVVRLPTESRPRDAISRKQLHFWNLPHPAVRWDILSWDPPVEGMNKRELSRDEIFHRKHAVKGGRLRVLLPSRRLSRVAEPNPPPTAVSQHVVITAAGVKIKLPPGSSSVKQNPLHPGPPDRPRESTVPSWRRTATPLTPLKRDRPPTVSVNSTSPDHQLNTTSRSPPPEPSTPLPEFIRPKSGTPSRPSSTRSATVSLPTILSPDTKSSTSRLPSGPDMTFFRTSRDESEADNNKPLPRFTVTSELDPGEPVELPLVKQLPAASEESAHVGMGAILGRSPREPPTETFLPRLVGSKPESKSSHDSVPGTRPITPPSTHQNSAWGNSPLGFPLKDSPARTAPDPEHLKAVWSQASERPSGSTSNSLKGIADDLPSIPFTVQDMKSEDGETPPPTAPPPPPSRLSLQEVTRAFQQVPDAPSSGTTSRPPSYPQSSLLSTGNSSHRSNQPVAISLPPQHNVRPAFAPYSHAMIGHSPSPTLMYAPSVPSPGSHHRMSVNGPSPPIAHGMWLPPPPPPPSQPGSFIRPTGVPPTQMMYPTPGAPGQLMHRRMSVVSPGVPPAAPGMYHGHPMDMQSHLHARSPHLAHAHPVGHPVPMPVGQMFSSPQPGQAPTMYAVPVGAGRGGMIMPRPNYEGYAAVPPPNANYQSVPSASFVFQS